MTTTNVDQHQQQQLNKTTNKSKKLDSLAILNNNQQQIQQNTSHLLAIVTPNGNCVCYRKNGTTRFVCSDSGGCLINNKGFVYYQWKWDDADLRFNEKVKSELNINVNFTSFFLLFF